MKLVKSILLELQKGLSFVFFFKNFLFSKIFFLKKSNIDNNNYLYIYFQDLIFTVNFLKYNTYLKANILADICVLDYPQKDFRFKIIYNLLSIKNSTRFFVVFFVKDFFDIPSLNYFFESSI